jgi:hypothetical protein
MRLNLVPAYGRDYTSKAKVKEAWDAGDDFLIQDVGSSDNGRYANKPDLAGQDVTVTIRYKRLTMVTTIAPNGRQL